MAAASFYERRPCRPWEGEGQMGKVISLDAYRRGLTVRGIAARLAGLGNEAKSVRKTVATRLLESTFLEKRAMSVAKLCSSALRRLEQQQTEREARRLLQPARRRSPSKEPTSLANVIRIVARRGT